MDGAQACYLYTTVVTRATLQRVGGRGGCLAAFGVSLRVAAAGADLGVSSKYSNENFED